MPTSRYERAARIAGYRRIAGLDEAGRGALFGPVFAAAVVLDPDRQIRGLDDSKQLDPDRREVLAERIRERAVAYGVGGADAFEIDTVNILEAARLAMQRAVARLNASLGCTAGGCTAGDVPETALPASVESRSRSRPESSSENAPAAWPGCDYLLVDALRLNLDLPQKALIHGDARSFSIAAASILAKVERDRALTAWDCVFPQYGLARNKGYGTPDHLAALDELGPTSLHRFSFEPVRKASRYQTWTGYPIPAQGELFPCQ